MKVDITDRGLTPVLGRTPGEEMATPVFLAGSDGIVSACNAGDTGSIPESGRSPGGGNGDPLRILA